MTREDEVDLLIAQGRRLWPEMALAEDIAADRLRLAMFTRDVPTGVKALTDWIDARAAMWAYANVDGAFSGA